MTLGTIGADDEEVLLGDRDGIWLDAIRSKRNGSPDPDVILVAH